MFRNQTANRNTYTCCLYVKKGIKFVLLKFLAAQEAVGYDGIAETPATMAQRDPVVERAESKTVLEKK